MLLGKNLACRSAKACAGATAVSSFCLFTRRAVVALWQPERPDSFFSCQAKILVRLDADKEKKDLEDSDQQESQPIHFHTLATVKASPHGRSDSWSVCREYGVLTPHHGCFKQPEVRGEPSVREQALADQGQGAWLGKIIGSYVVDVFMLRT